MGVKWFAGEEGRVSGPSLCRYKGGQVASRVSSLDVSLVWCTAPGLDNFMTAAEKEKLYTAIGYSDSSHNLALPKQVRSPAAFNCLHQMK